VFGDSTEAPENLILRALNNSGSPMITIPLEVDCFLDPKIKWHPHFFTTSTNINSDVKALTKKFLSFIRVFCVVSVPE
jgi:hypothetical protein